VHSHAAQRWVGRGHTGRHGHRVQAGGRGRLLLLLLRQLLLMQLLLLQLLLLQLLRQTTIRAFEDSFTASSWATTTIVKTRRNILDEGIRVLTRYALAILLVSYIRLEHLLLQLLLLLQCLLLQLLLLQIEGGPEGPFVYTEVQDNRGRAAEEQLVQADRRAENRSKICVE
jgi:hypothetical protein